MEFDRSGSAEDRFWRWRTIVAVLFDAAVGSRRLLDGFDARLTAHRMPHFVLLRMGGVGHILRRSPTLIVRASIDHHMVWVHGSERCTLGTQAGGERVLSAGSISVIDLSLPVHVSSSAFDDVCLILPRSVLLPLVSRAETLHGLVIPGGSGLAGLVGAHLRSLADRAQGLAPAEFPTVSDLTLRVVEPLLGQFIAGLESSDVIARHLVVAIRREIERRLTARDLNVDDLAERFNLSRATLYRAFAVQGGVAAYIRDRRLARALRDITAPSLGHRRIGEIAYGWGFQNEAAFSKAFRKSFGLSPREARVAAMPCVREEASGSPAGDTISAWLKDLSALPSRTDIERGDA